MSKTPVRPNKINVITRKMHKIQEHYFLLSFQICLGYKEEDLASTISVVFPIYTFFFCLSFLFLVTVSKFIKRHAPL